MRGGYPRTTEDHDVDPMSTRTAGVTGLEAVIVPDRRTGPRGLGGVQTAAPVADHRDR